MPKRLDYDLIKDIKVFSHPMEELRRLKRSAYSSLFRC